MISNTNGLNLKTEFLFQFLSIKMGGHTENKFNSQAWHTDDCFLVISKEWFQEITL